MGGRRELDLLATLQSCSLLFTGVKWAPDACGVYRRYTSCYHSRHWPLTTASAVCIVCLAISFLPSRLCRIGLPLLLHGSSFQQSATMFVIRRIGFLSFRLLLFFYDKILCCSSFSTILIVCSTLCLLSSVFVDIRWSLLLTYDSFTTPWGASPAAARTRDSHTPWSPTITSLSRWNLLRICSSLVDTLLRSKSSFRELLHSYTRPNAALDLRRANAVFWHIEFHILFSDSCDSGTQWTSTPPLRLRLRLSVQLPFLRLAIRIESIEV